MEIKFYDEKGNVRVDLFSKEAERLAEDISDEGRNKKGDVKKNTVTQLRKFYDEVLKNKAKIKNDNDFKNLLPYIKMLHAKVKYAQARGHVTKKFTDFIKVCLEQINTREDFEVFADFFEAFMGFYKYYGEIRKNAGG